MSDFLTFECALTFLFLNHGISEWALVFTSLPFCKGDSSEVQSYLTESRPKETEFKFPRNLTLDLNSRAVRSIWFFTEVDFEGPKLHSRISRKPNAPKLHVISFQKAHSKTHRLVSKTGPTDEVCECLKYLEKMVSLQETFSNVWVWYVCVCRWRSRELTNKHTDNGKYKQTRLTPLFHN